MAITLSQIISERRPKVVRYGDHEVNIVYNPAVLTLEMAESPAATSNASAMVDMLAAILVEWDLTEDDGTVIPTTRESMAKIPLVFLARVLETITSDDHAGEAQGGTFAGG